VTRILPDGDQQVETIAIYWEPIIKTYGFLEKSGLALCRLVFPLEQTAEWGRRIQEMSSSGDGFLLALGQLVDRETLQFNLLLEAQGLARIRLALEQRPALEAQTGIEIETPVELLYFQGPHFGDRYGIADAVWTCLIRRKVPVLALTCTGASVYLILPEGQTATARAALGEAFEAPEAGNREQGS
jgi:hypothetical protein